MKRTCAVLLISMLVFPNCAVHGAASANRHVAAATAGSARHGQESPDLWRQFAGKLPVGSLVRVRTNGGRLTGSLLLVDETGIVVKPKTRLPELARRVAFDHVEQLELVKSDGASLARAAVVGGAVGVGAFFSLMLIFAAIVGD